VDGPQPQRLAAWGRDLRKPRPLQPLANCREDASPQVSAT